MIYFIHAVGAKAVKIGYTDVSAKSRLTSLQIGCPFELRIVAETKGEMAAEKILHKWLRKHRARGEWFWRCPKVDTLVRAVMKGKPLTECCPHIEQRHLEKGTPGLESTGDFVKRGGWYYCPMRLMRTDGTQIHRLVPLGGRRSDADIARQRLQRAIAKQLFWGDAEADLLVYQSPEFESKGVT